MHRPRSVAFTVTGGVAAGTLPVSGFTLVDARGAAPDPDLGPIEDGATVDVGPADGQVSIRADLAYSSGIGSVRLELTGPVSVTRVEQAAPFSLFGNDRRGDYYAGRLPDGAYTITATPYSGRDGQGEALPGLTVAFTVTGLTPPAITGFTLIDASGDAAVSELGPVPDGGTVDVSPRGRPGRHPRRGDRVGGQRSAHPLGSAVAAAADGRYALSRCSEWTTGAATGPAG